MLKIGFVAQVNQNKLVFEDPVGFSKWLGQFVDKKVVVSVEKKTRKRSTGKEDEKGNQNGYYRGFVVPPLARFSGNTQKEMHEVLLDLYAPKVCKNFGDKKIMVTIRTSDMNTVQMAEFTETCRMAGAEMGVNIAPPKKVY